jgi:hypothetical protein
MTKRIKMSDQLYVGDLVTIGSTGFIYKVCEPSNNGSVLLYSYEEKKTAPYMMDAVTKLSFQDIMLYRLYRWLAFREH